MKIKMNQTEENVLRPLVNRPSPRNGPRIVRIPQPPPQPHMCVQDTLKNSKHPCFINVMSWCKVSLPSEPDNVPLYGGVQIPLSDKYQVETKNGKCKPLVFAVMANPQFLKESGKSAPSIQERDSLIYLMLDFVEAMNTNIQFSRNFTVLKDRDLTGELKDIWAVIQNKRDIEKRSPAHSKIVHPDENSRPSTPENIVYLQRGVHNGLLMKTYNGAYDNSRPSTPENTVQEDDTQHHKNRNINRYEDELPNGEESDTTSETQRTDCDADESGDS